MKIELKKCPICKGKKCSYCEENGEIVEHTVESRDEAMAILILLQR